MGEGFMAKLMALLSGSKGEETGETMPDNEAAEAPPWATSPGAAAPPGFHRMPDGSLMKGPTMQGPGRPPAAPQGPPGMGQDEITALIQKLQQQRDVAKRLLPQEQFINR